MTMTMTMTMANTRTGVAAADSVSNRTFSSSSSLSTTITEILWLNQLHHLDSDIDASGDYTSWFQKLDGVRWWLLSYSQLHNYNYSQLHNYNWAKINYTIPIYYDRQITQCQCSARGQTTSETFSSPNLVRTFFLVVTCTFPNLPHELSLAEKGPWT